MGQSISAKGSVGTGIAVIIVRDGKVLVGKRLGSHNAGKWSFPGGHLDGGERWEEAARREVLEETGLVLDNLSVVGVGNNYVPQERLQYTTIYLRAHARGEPKLLEPAKCEGWIWVDVNSVPIGHMTPGADLRALGLGSEDEGESLNFVRVEGALDEMAMQDIAGICRVGSVGEDMQKYFRDDE